LKGTSVYEAGSTLCLVRGDTQEGRIHKEYLFPLQTAVIDQSKGFNSLMKTMGMHNIKTFFIVYKAKKA
jgi:hypothetical protein